jgi:hypothetical protein
MHQSFDRVCGCGKMGYISSADQKSLAQRYRMTAVGVASFAFSALVLILLPSLLRAETPTTDTFNWPRILAISALLWDLPRSYQGASFFRLWFSRKQRGTAEKPSSVD